MRSIDEIDEQAVEVAVIGELSDRINDLFLGGTDFERARTLAMDTIGRAQLAGLTSRAIDIALMAAYYLEWSANDSKRARDVLDSVYEIGRGIPSSHAFWESRSGMLLWAQGDLDQAVRAYRIASQQAIRLEDDDLSDEALPMYATTLADRGYFNAALYWSKYALSHVSADSARHGQVIETAAWVNLVLRRGGHPYVDPVGPYERAVRLFEPGGPFPDHGRLGAAVLGLAEAHLLSGRPQAARGQLDRLARSDDGSLPLDDRAFRDDLDLRIELELGASLASLERGLRQLEWSARRAGTPEAMWWLAVRRGDVFARSGRSVAAVAAYRDSEDLVDDLVRYAAFGVGRASVGAIRQEGAVRLAGLLLELGRPQEALCALREAEGRRAQTPRLESLEPELRSWAAAYMRKKRELDDAIIESDGATEEERRRVQKRVTQVLDGLRGEINSLLRRSGRRVVRPPACVDLAPINEGELLLGLYPAGDEWLVFAQDDQGTTSYRVRAIQPPHDARQREFVSEQLLQPISERLRRAVRVRVLASDDAKRLDVQTLPWLGRPLLASVTVVHGAEIVPAPLRDWPGRPLALLVADPTQTLPEADGEVARVATALSAAGFTTNVLAPGQAHAAAVGQLLERVDLLHFSGHSSYPGVEEHGRWPPYAGGTPGAASHLVLMGDQRLAAHDIMLLRSVPRVAVLAGCEAGALEREIGGTSLALAFLAGGSRAVVASPELLNDESAAALVRQLYGSIPGNGRFDAAEALRQAQADLWHSVPDPELSLGRYRVWVP